MSDSNHEQDETHDLETLAAKGKHPPPEAKRFRIRIDKEHFEVDRPVMTGREILALVGKAQPQFKLVQRLHGGKTKVIGPDEPVDFRSPGIERFNTLPCDQTEGEAPRRQFDFASDDVDFLNSLGFPWETIVEGSARWVIIHAFRVPEGYAHSEVDLAIQIPPGYPDAALDMAFFHPALAREDGKAIKATNSSKTIAGRSFQRWSRHRTSANPWQAGVDSIATHVHLIEDWLTREFS